MSCPQKGQVSLHPLTVIDAASAESKQLPQNEQTTHGLRELASDMIAARELDLRITTPSGYTTSMKDSKPQQTPDPDPAPFTAFDELVRKVMAVPKAEIDKREAEYQKQQAKKPKRGPKPGPKSK